LAALRVFLGHEAEHSARRVLSNLARSWQASEDAALPGQVAEILTGMSAYSPPASLTSGAQAG